MKPSKRILNLPPYPFADLNRKKLELQSKGVDFIDLSIGDPDLPTPAPIVEAMQKAIKKSEHHHYPDYDGSLAFKEAVARWIQNRFGVELNPKTEICALIGSKEGIANIHYAFVDPQDTVLVPTPGYPVYAVATKFAMGNPFYMELQKDRGFLPDLEKIPKNIWDKAKLMHLNYPNNPTGATANKNFFDTATKLAKEHNTIICHDNAYSEIYFDHEKPPSFLQSTGAKEIGIEFHSLSKTFNMTGWRLGFAVGNKEAVQALAKIKTNVDSGVFSAIQEAGIYALDHADALAAPIRKIYQERRDVFVPALNKAGLKVQAPKATFYLWVEVGPKSNSKEFAERLLQRGVVATPGSAFGEAGEGFIRLTLTASKEKLLEAANRIKGI